jgi:hypothetical protein
MKIILNINIIYHFENIYTSKTERKNGKRKKKKISVIKTNLGDRAFFLIPLHYMMSADSQWAPFYLENSLGVIVG